MILIWSNDRIERFKYYFTYTYLLLLCFSGHYYDWQKGQVRICCHADLKLNCSPKFRCNIHHHSHLGARTMNSSANSDGAIERETISHSLVWNKILYSLKSKLLKPDHRSRAAQGDYWERRTELELNIRTFHLIHYNHLEDTGWCR